jgi:hypothetical protein
MRTIFAEEISKSGASDIEKARSGNAGTGKRSEVPEIDPPQRQGQSLGQDLRQDRKLSPLPRGVVCEVQREVPALSEGFAAYADAKKFADDRAKELASASRVTALTPVQADDALAAFDKLASYFQSTGRKLSLVGSVTEHLEAIGRLPAGLTLGDALSGYLNTVATVNADQQGSLHGGGKMDWPRICYCGSRRKKSWLQLSTSQYSAERQ